MRLRRRPALPSLPSVSSPEILRPRRRRRTEAMRQLVREHELSPGDLIQPVFVVHGRDVEREIASMPGVFHLSVDGPLDREAERLEALGIPGLILFGLPAAKDEIGSENYAADGIVQQALRQLKARHPGLLLFTDVCCCEYTSHGHCGILRDGSVDNDATLAVLGRVAVSHAEAGADIVAPSGMMDGMVGAIRSALDQASFTERGILSYAVKYASAFYGPFREAADSAPAFGDRRQYQMDPANVREAVLEASLDEAQGADMLMVKPALAYLDVVRAVRERTTLPLLAYNVSGEYSMVKAAAAQGWIDERGVVLEAMLGMRRAGADAIITYHAKDVAAWLAGDTSR
ncbi:MAG TPA: porphobilinogen synthase [Gemmatimonadales bacterium]|nr:porphobilinogen synthase [Gemmatimonadales bacterium]